MVLTDYRDHVSWYLNEQYGNTVMENMVLPWQKRYNHGDSWLTRVFALTGLILYHIGSYDFSIASGIQVHTHHFWSVPKCLPHSEVKLLPADIPCNCWCACALWLLVRISSLLRTSVWRDGVIRGLQLLMDSLRFSVQRWMELMQ